MPGSTLGNLTAASAVAGTDLFYTVQTVGVGGVKQTATALKTFMSASPTLVTPVLGVATGTSFNGLTVTTTTGTFTLTNAKVLSVSNSLTLAGTDTTTMTFPSTSATIARTDAAQTFTGKQSFATSVATASAPLQHPQGRLTLTSNTPVMSGDATAQTSVYYTPYIGAMIPIYDGTNWVSTPFTQLTMALDTTNQLLNNVYDLFVWNNAGTIAIGAGPAWSNTATITVTIAAPAVVSWTGHGLKEGDPVVFTTTGALPTGITAGTTYFVSSTSLATNAFDISTTVANAAAGTNITTTGSQSGTHTGTNHTKARGTGAGTTQLQMLNGVWTNQNSITLTNGAGGGTAGVTANTATYVGSIFCTANGQTGMAFLPAAAAGGSANTLGVYNAYNRVGTRATSRDSTASWTKASTTWGPADASVSNRISFLDGLQGSSIRATWQVMVSPGATANGYTGLAIDTTTGNPNITSQTNTAAVDVFATVSDGFPPQLGYHFVTGMESSTNTTTFFGAASTPTRQLNGLVFDMEM